MLRPGLSRALLKVLLAGEFSPVDLLDIRAVGARDADVIRLVGNYGQDLAWNGYTYLPLSISHGEIQDIVASEAGSIPSVTVMLSNVDLQLARALGTADFKQAKATLRVADRRLLSNPGDALTIITGEVQNPQLSESTMVFEIENVVAQLERITLPRRLFKPTCNATFGSFSCGVNLGVTPNTIQDVSLAGTTEYYVVVTGGLIANGGADPTDFWANGYLWFVDGPAGTQARPVSRVDAATNRIFVSRPFGVNPGVGSTFLLRRGCRKTYADCIARGNTVNFQGFPDVPFGRIRPRKFAEPTGGDHHPPGGPIGPHS